MFISMLAAYCVANSRYGRTLRSIRENEQLARSIGVNTNMHKVGAFMLSGLFAGVGGDLQAYNFRHISPDLYGGATSLYFALMVMLGGPRTIFGPLAGAIIVTFLPEVMRIDPVDSRIAYGLALIAVVMLLPGGVIAAAGRGLSMGHANPPRSARERGLHRPWRFVDLRNCQTVATLEIRDLRKTFGGVVALAGVDVTIQSEEILGVIGPNGSGKTTLFNTVCGVYRPNGGTIHWNGVDIAGKPAYTIGRLGLGRTFQQAMSFPSLTVRENVQIAIEHGSRREEGAGPRWSSAEELLEFVGLEGFAEELTSVMPFGNLRRLGVAVALGGRPAQLLLDEPAAGLNEGESVQLTHLLRRAHELGVGVCIIDHHVGLMAELCARLVVLHFGNKIADGPTEAVLNDPKVIEVYLGGDE